MSFGAVLEPTELIFYLVWLWLASLLFPCMPLAQGAFETVFVSIICDYALK
jgi:hypothetical protein